MNGRVGSEPAECLFTLPFGADRLAAGRLVREDDGVHEALEEVALLARRCAPCELECLVRVEPLAATRAQMPVPRQPLPAAGEPRAALLIGADTGKVGTRYGDDPARGGRSLP